MTSEIRRRIPPMPSWLPPVVYGFAFWLAFLLVLEPDNLLRAWHAGYVLPLEREVARISAAGCSAQQWQRPFNGG